MKKTCGLLAVCVIPTKVRKLTPDDPVTNRNVKLFNPRQQKWLRHFAWTNNGTHLAGLTATGRATVLALQLNNSYAVTVRQAWVSAGWHPPTEN